MVVAGANVGVALQAVVVAPHHKNNLGMGLESDHAVGNMDACLFQGGCPVNIGRLIKTRHQFHHHCHLFAVLHGIEQIFDDLRVG